MRLVILILLAIVSSVVAAPAPPTLAFYPIPECVYSGDATCTTDGAEGGGTTRFTTPPATGFTSVGGGFAIEAENCRLVGSMTTVAETTASNGNYVSLPSTVEPFAGQIGCKADFACTNCYVYLVMRQPTTLDPHVWAHTAAVFRHIDNALAGLIHGGAEQPSFQPFIFGRYGAAFGDPGEPGFNTQIMGTPTQQLTFTNESGLFLTWSPGRDLDYIFVHSSASATPQPPGGGGGSVVTYEVLKINTAAPTSCADSRFANATTVNWTGGYKSTTDADPTCRFLWEDTTTDRLYACCTMPDNDLRGVTTAHDTASSLYDGDDLEIQYRASQSAGTRDAATFKRACNVRGARFDANYPSGASDISNNSNMTCTVTLTGDLDNTADDTSWQVFLAFDLGFAGSDNFVFNGDILRYDVDAASTYQIAFGQASLGFNEPINWKTWKLSSTIVGGGDSTLPTISTTNEQNVTAGSFEVVTTGSDNASPGISSRVRYGTTTTGPYPNTSNVVNTSGTCTTSCTSVNLVTGLAPSTTYFYVVEWTDQSGNVRTSAEDSRVTSAAGTTRYIGPAGIDTGACTTSGSPCRTWAFVMPLMNPNETLIVKNGTYTTATNGNLTATCQPGGSIKNGLSGQPITIRGENQRQAFLQNDGVRGAVRFSGCSYWIIDGLRVESVDNASYIDSGTLIQFRAGSHHNHIINNLLRNVNRYAGGGGVLLWESGTSNNLVANNELSNFDRNGFSNLSAHTNVFRQNYCRGGDSRGADPKPGGGPNACYVVYYSNDSIVENNIAENIADSYSTPAMRNKFLGNIAINTNNGILLSKHNQEGTVCRDNLIENHVSVSGSNTINGVFTRSCINSTIKNVSVFGGTGIGVVSDNNYDPRQGAGKCLPYNSICTVQQDPSFTVLNTIVSGTPTGYSVTHSTQFASREFRYSQGWGNTTVWGQGTETREIATTPPGGVTGSSDIGSCKTYIPLTSSLSGAGLAGADIGANVIYQYVNGSLTSTPLWVTSAPSGYGGTPFERYFVGCKAVIAGVNDAHATSCVGTADRLAVTSVCLPSSYP